MRNAKNPPHETGARLVSKELQNDGLGEDYARNNDLNVSNLNIFHPQYPTTFNLKPKP
jgi:hypothetical protein